MTLAPAVGSSRVPIAAVELTSPRIAVPRARSSAVLRKASKFPVLPLVLVLALTTAGSSRADLPCDETCSVNRNCSSTGLLCDPDDRACTSAATGKGLEVKCEQRCERGKRYVYCPPDTGRSDSSFIWVLLALAGLLAVGGTSVAWTVLRRKG